MPLHKGQGGKALSGGAEKAGRQEGDLPFNNLLQTSVSAMDLYSCQGTLTFN